MAYYRTCPNCGCTLDPGETCDCMEEAARERVAREKRVREMSKLIVIDNSNNQFCFNFGRAN